MVLPTLLELAAKAQYAKKDWTETVDDAVERGNAASSTATISGASTIVAIISIIVANAVSAAYDNCIAAVASISTPAPTAIALVGRIR
jgi:hypothetical protein